MLRTTLCILVIATPAHAFDLSFDGLTGWQQCETWTAHAEALAAIDGALEALQVNHGRIRCGRYEPYRRWFGAWTVAGYNRVVSVYAASRAALERTSYHATGLDVLAYTYLGGGDIWLGADFWLCCEPWGVVIHEASHWSWTLDLRLYLPASERLAAMSWNRAAENANNYWAFAGAVSE